MTREVALLLVLGVGALMLVLAWVGWRGRLQRAEVHVLRPYPRPEGVALERFPVLYVATTEAEKPLERVALRPLAYRAKATLEVFEDALVIEITGEGEVVIPWSDVDAVGRATWTIDRVVDFDGLVFLRWRAGESLLDSYFRAVDCTPDQLTQSLHRRHGPVAREESA